MSHDEFLIIGDSFAAHRSEDSDWPRLLATLQTDVTQTPRGQGFGGASWWSTRKCLLTELAIKVPKVLVLCHTESGRLPSDFNFGINVSTVCDIQAQVTLPAGQEHNGGHLVRYLFYCNTICNVIFDETNNLDW